MTTAVNLECPVHSHWHLKVTVEDKLWDPKSKSYVPGEYTKVENFTLAQGEKRTVYIHDSRRLVVEEIVPEPVKAAPVETKAE